MDVRSSMMRKAVIPDLTLLPLELEPPKNRLSTSGGRLLLESSTNVSLESPTEFCSTVRTVGYVTSNGKPFMSGKCPNCNKNIKEPSQLCRLPNSPAPGLSSRLKFDLKSPFRSPPRSAQKVDGKRQSAKQMRSPLRSPFGGRFF
ncbi:unnamed protein product, partial [Choristocarpus tenellus]